MMKKQVLFSILTVYFLNSFFNPALGQESEYLSTSCGSFESVNENCPSVASFPISVSGEGIMGANNRGIVEVNFEIDMPIGFFADARLVAPNGESFILASGQEGINSFPDFSGGLLMTSYRDCPEYPDHNDIIGQSPDFGTFQPLENFTLLNDGATSPNGTWEVQVCGLPDNFFFSCGAVVFGPLCPEITSTSVVNPTCNTSSDGSITINVDEGACEALYYSIDGENYFMNNTFSGLSAGNYAVSVANEDLTISGNNLTSSCLVTADVVLESLDNESPSFDNCPMNMTIEVNENCEGIYSITDPTPLDNCQVASAIQIITNPDGSTEQYNIAPGTAFNYNSDLGLTELEWIVTDDSGLTFSCLTEITVVDVSPPILMDCPINITISANEECQGVVQVTDPTFADNCEITTSTHEITLPNGEIQTFDITPGGTFTYTLDLGVYEFEYIVVDDSGLSTTCTSFITIVDVQPPVISGIPADVTINCSDQFPDMPEITAFDICDGNIMDLDLSDDVTVGTCVINEISETIVYTWIATDEAGNMQEASWTITVINSESIELGDDIIACEGETILLSPVGFVGSYEWSTGEITPEILVQNSGLYFVTVTSESGCCSVDEINVVFENFPDAGAVGGVLDCTGDPVVLMASSSSSDVEFSWVGPGGFTSAEQNPEVNQEGSYTLSVENGAGCITEAVAFVTTDNDVPNVSTEGGTIDCIEESIMISGNSTTSDVTYSWTGPNGFSSTDQNPNVEVAGEYNLTVTASNGCSAEGLAVVLNDTNIPSVSIVDATINCNQLSIDLEVTTDAVDPTFAWSGPNGFTSNMESPTIDLPGEYQVTVTDDNGCFDMATSTITQDISVPDVNVIGGELNCSDPIININASSNTENVVFSWTGPNGFSSSEQNPEVDFPGNYVVVVEGENGCSSSASTEVTQDISIPIFSLENGQLDCTTTEINLDLSSGGENLTFQWTGPNGFESEEMSPLVSEPGEYQVIVTGENGCISQASLEVTEDVMVPGASAQGGNITCENNTVQLMGESENNESTFSWMGPNGFQSAEQNPIVGSAGEYTLTVSGINGCISTATAIVEADEDLPNVSATGGVLSCLLDSIQLTSGSSTPGVTFQWVGPNGFSSVLQNPSVGQAGTYTLTVESENGCISTLDVTVGIDNLEPLVSILGGELDCDNTSIVLMSNSSVNVSYDWIGPNGFTSDLQNPEVTSSGEYSLVVTAENGCTNTATTTVTQNADLPQVELNDPEFDCNNSIIKLTLEEVGSYNYEWYFNGELFSTADFVTIVSAGLYEIIATAENGCMLRLEYILEENFVPVTADVSTTSATSTEGGSAEFLSNMDSIIESIEWDNGDTGFSAFDLNVGEHSVIVTTIYGCEYEFFFVIEMKTSTDDEETVSLINVRPTLSRGMINVDIELEKAEKCNALIYSTQGQLILKREYNMQNVTDVLDLNAYPKGLYLIVIKVKGKSYVEKITLY